jgi:hypothetical protein
MLLINVAEKDRNFATSLQVCDGDSGAKQPSLLHDQTDICSRPTT